MKRDVVEICIGTPCHLMGAQDLIDAVRSLPEDRLDKIRLRTVPCLKQCDNAPAVRINGEIFSGMTPEKLIKKIR